MCRRSNDTDGNRRLDRTTNRCRTRRRDLAGFVLGVFRIEDIVDRALEGFASRRLQLILKDELGGGTTELLYRKSCWKGDGGIQPEAAYSDDRVEQTVAVATHKWQASWVPTEGAKAGGRKWIAFVAVVIGLIATATVATYLHVLLGRKQAVEALVGERTNDLTETNQALEHARQQLVQTNLELEALAQVDALTGMANRRRFDETLDKELGRARREGRPLSLILCDVNFFKIYNDTYGHVAGDACLEKVARTIESTFHRSSDHVSRYGGEEFAAILPGCDLEGALPMAQQLCDAVFDLGIDQASPRTFGRITVNVGLATLEPGRATSAQALTQAADGALYRSKATGRNRVETDASSAEPVGQIPAA